MHFKTALKFPPNFHQNRKNSFIIIFGFNRSLQTKSLTNCLTKGFIRLYIILDNAV